jgi:hypothetical protein
MPPYAKLAGAHPTPPYPKLSSPSRCRVAGRAGRPPCARHVLDRAPARQAPHPRGARSAACGRDVCDRHDGGARPRRVRRAAREQGRALRPPRRRPWARGVRRVSRRHGNHPEGSRGGGSGRRRALRTGPARDRAARRGRQGGGPPFASPPHSRPPRRRRPHRHRLPCGRSARQPRLRSGGRAGSSRRSDRGNRSAAPPDNRLPKGGMPAEDALGLVGEEVLLDGLPMRNLATFVTTWMEPEADRVDRGIAAHQFHRSRRVPADSRDRAARWGPYRECSLWMLTRVGGAPGTLGSGER